MAQPAEPERLAETLIGQYTLEAEMYQALLFLAREQGGLLKYDKDIGSYAALLPRKDELLRSIGLIERDLEPLKRRWWAMDVGAESRARLNRLLDGLLGTIEALREQEERNERLLASQGEAAERSIRQLRLAAQLSGELAGATAPVPCEA